MKAEIIAIGSELLTPYRQDTNSLFLTAKLNQLGVEVGFKTIVGDRRGDLVGAARAALQRADVIIFMGGLGPTEDDLTREAVAETLARTLRRDEEIVAWLRARFAERGLKMPENNARQGDIIEGAEMLPNKRGSAPGQFLYTLYLGKMRAILLLPGPPAELTPMFEEQCVERLRKVVPALYIATRELKIAMIGESLADKRAAPIYSKRTDVETTILAGTPGEVQLHLRAQADTQVAAQKKVDTLASALEEEFDDAVFSAQGESLEQIVGYYLEMRGATLAVAESCTGGLLAERITSVPGSSRYFLGGAVVYSNQLKVSLAGVKPSVIKQHGAVSNQVAAGLAEGIRERTKATFGVGITGIAGPTGGTPEKPVGLVYTALADGNKTDVIERKFFGDRARVRHWATQQALDMVRRKLM
ncbi:MAG TPA: competence/damage-inducible protein A [Candidatus Angelobacter sp.]|nr:competence/damage-inducible protein A [Candidatus Angelobacter sp.]